MGASVDGAPDLSRMDPGVPGRSPDTHLAALPVRLGAVETPPVALHPHAPSPRLGVPDRRLDLLVGVTGPIRRSHGYRPECEQLSTIDIPARNQEAT